VPTRSSFRFALITGSALLAGCTVGPDFQRPSLWSPASWFAARPKPDTASAASQPVPEKVDPNWWTLFHDPELTTLENRVVAANLDVRLATIRLAESRAQGRIARADQFPSVDGNASYSREELSHRGVISLFGNGTGGSQNGIPSSATGSPPPRIPPFNLWQYGFDASWELDLWGRVRRSVEEADASVDASAEARRSAVLSVVAELARDYMQLRGIQAEIDITERNLRTAQETLDLTRSRYRGGVTTELDVANAATQVATTAAQLPQQRQREEETINALSFLLGEAPGALRAELETPQAVPPVPPRVPIGVPSELARRRPDIREAEAQLHAATADVGVAVADFYPQVSLTGSLGLQALHFQDLANWDARQYALGPSITLPIFQGGRLRATLELRKQQQQEAAITYQRTVLQAWHEVDNALTAYAEEQARRDQLAVAVSESQRALDLARVRYTQGVTDFLNVLDAERALLAAQLQLADSTTTVSNNLVQLYKALGGGWETAYPAAEAVAGTRAM